MRKFYKGVPTQEYLMSQIKPLPKDFDSFVKKIFESDNRIFITNVGKKKWTGICQNCGHMFELTNVSHNQKYRCPHCNKNATLKNTKFRSSLMENVKDYICYCDETDFGIVARYFKIYKQNKSLSAEYEFIELERDFDIGDLNFREYQKRFYGGEGNEKWIKGQYYNFYDYLPMNFWLYRKNIKKLLSRKYPTLKYCQLSEYSKKCMVDPVKYLVKYQRRPQIEYFVKIGMTNLVRDFLADSYQPYMDFSKKKLSEIIQINDKDNVAFCVKNNLGVRGISRVRALDENGERATVELLEFIEQQGFFSIKEMTYTAAKNYYDTLPKEYQGRYFLRDYSDYINAAKFLGYNLKDTAILKPKNFKEMHDRTIQIKIDKQNKVKNSQFKKAMKKYLELAFEYGGYSVVIPQKATDVIFEGKEMHHCVGGYVDRVLEDKSIIVFVRSVNNITAPLVTVEVNPKDYSIVQARAKNNADPSPEVKKMLKKYKEYLKALKEPQQNKQPERSFDFALAV